MRFSFYLSDGNWLVNPRTDPYLNEIDFDCYPLWIQWFYWHVDGWQEPQWKEKAIRLLKRKPLEPDTFE